MKYLTYVLVICGCAVVSCGDAATPTASDDEKGASGVPDDGGLRDDATCYSWIKSSNDHTNCDDVSRCNKAGTHTTTCEVWKLQSCNEDIGLSIDLGFGLWRFVLQSFGLTFGSNSRDDGQEENRNPKCICKVNVGGLQCDECKGGHGEFPDCGETLGAKTITDAVTVAEMNLRDVLTDAIMAITDTLGLKGYNRES